MKKLDKFFITTLVAGLGLFTSALVTPIEPVQALIGTNQIENNAITSPKIKDGEVKTNDLATAAVTKEKLNPNAVKLVLVERTEEFTVRGSDAAVGHVLCDSGEFVTGGGFKAITGPSFNVWTSTKSGNGWSIGVDNEISTDQNVEVSAICAHLELGP
jgi:hypothetical protein